MQIHWLMETNMWFGETMKSTFEHAKNALAAEAAPDPRELISAPRTPSQ